MAGINDIRRINVLKILKSLKDNYGIDRSNFAELSGLGYNLLNQYLSDNAKKNIGSKTATKITSPLGIEAEWIDQVRNDHEINLILTNKFGATKSVANDTKKVNSSIVKPYKLDTTAFTILPILKTIFIYRGKELEIIENESVEYTIEVPSSVIEPIAMEVVGSGYNKPYKNGFIILCDGSVYPQGGEDAIIKTINNKFYVGEFLYDRPDEIEIETIEGIREILKKIDIEKISTIVAYFTQRHKVAINN